VTPSRNGGSTEGFAGLAERTVVLEGPQAEQLGRAVRAAMGEST